MGVFSVQSHLNVDQWIMARDRHRLNRLKKGKDADAKQYQELFEKSNLKVRQRLERLPNIKLNQDLPVTQYTDKLIAAIQKHQVIIVAGETGSGKTTQLPQIAMLAGCGLTGMIGHTQPRRLAARSVSQRIAEEVGEKLGESISFKVRFTEQGSQDSIVRLMTDGILLAELTHDRYLTKYDTLIIDEAHERSLNIDFIMGYLKQLLPRRPDLKVIITSATLDVNRFSSYFNGAPIFEVEGRSFPVELRYRPISEMSIGGSDDDEFDDFESSRRMLSGCTGKRSSRTCRYPDFCQYRAGNSRVTGNPDQTWATPYGSINFICASGAGRTAENL